MINLSLKKIQITVKELIGFLHLYLQIQISKNLQINLSQMALKQEDPFTLFIQ